MISKCAICGQPVEFYPDAISARWTHIDLDLELSADHPATPEIVR